MAYYSYKRVRNLVPDRITESIEDYEGSADYDGDLWIAAEMYILELQAKLAEHEEWRKEFIAGQVAYYDGKPWSLKHSDGWHAGWALSDFNSREND